MKRTLLVLVGLLLAFPVWADPKEEEAERALQTMIASVQDGNEPMRNRMFIQLRVLGDVSVGPILEALDDSSADVRLYLAFTLGWFTPGSRVIEPLLALFQNDPEIPVRCKAAESLGRLESVEAVDPLVAALSESDARVRQSAAFALGQIGDARAKPALEKAKSDTDEVVRFFAEEALVEIDRAAARRGN